MNDEMKKDLAFDTVNELLMIFANSNEVTDKEFVKMLTLERNLILRNDKNTIDKAIDEYLPMLRRRNNG
ncbi:MAG: hypothetical protein IJ538_03160 [Clostridia bacterium]|nr:hypothetical protein [Clostridia bacterium]